MIAGTYINELAKDADERTSEKEASEAVNGQRLIKQSFVKVRLERCCISVEISLQKKAAAHAMSSVISTAASPFRASAWAAKKIFKH